MIKTGDFRSASILRTEATDKHVDAAVEGSGTDGSQQRPTDDPGLSTRPGASKGRPTGGWNSDRRSEMLAASGPGQAVTGDIECEPGEPEAGLFVQWRPRGPVRRFPQRASSIGTFPFLVFSPHVTKAVATHDDLSLSTLVGERNLFLPPDYIGGHQQFTYQCKPRHLKNMRKSVRGAFRAGRWLAGPA